MPGDDGNDLDTDDELFLHDVALNLRRRADRKIRHALQIGRLTLEGYRPGEIRKRLNLTQREYLRASEWLADAIRATPRQPKPPRNRGSHSG